MGFRESLGHELDVAFRRTRATRALRRARRRDVRRGAGRCRRCGCTDNFGCRQLGDPHDPMNPWATCSWTSMSRDLCSACVPPCPHCGSTVVDRGFTGLDLCSTCGGLSRDGGVLTERDRPDPTRVLYSKGLLGALSSAAPRPRRRRHHLAELRRRWSDPMSPASRGRR